MKRIYSLDYLRGAIAIAIMCYHFSLFTGVALDASTFLGRVGIFGVSIFYMLSGLTLFHVYQHKMQFNRKDIQDFFKKRFFRIFPLLWLVTLLSVYLYAKPIVYSTLLLNLSGLFGLFAWHQYLATGAWSIGNELVFYLFFPLMVFLSNRHQRYFYAFSSLFLLVFLYFVFVKLQPQIQLAQQWKIYTNPLHQGFSFLLGFWIGFLFEKFKIHPLANHLLFLLALLAFIFYPATGNQIHIVTRYTKIIFTLLSFAMCFWAYKNEYTLPQILHRPLLFLGEISYGIYLFHPLVYAQVSSYFFKAPFQQLSKFQKLSIPFITTIIISYLVYQYYEKFFVKLGKKFK